MPKKNTDEPQEKENSARVIEPSDRARLKTALRQSSSLEEQLALVSPSAPGRDGGPSKTSSTTPKARRKETPEERIDRLLDGLDYDGLMTAFADDDTAQSGVTMGKDMRVVENGGLFIEALNRKASRDYFGGDRSENVQTTRQEKLHVPARANDVAQRWAIVSALCLKRGIVNWKVAKQDLLQNTVSGADKAFALLSSAGLLDAKAKQGKPAVSYVEQALDPKRRETLRKFLGNPQNFDDLPRGELAQEVIVKVEGAVLDDGAFPAEQSGREITVYILPNLLESTKEWSAFVSEMYAAFEGSGLPMLPIAAGDRAIAGGSKKKGGKTVGYFSYRNEANARDKKLDYTGFPHWMGGNAGKVNAAKQKMQLAKAKVTKPAEKKKKGKKKQRRWSRAT